MAKYNTEEFLKSLEPLKFKDLYFSGSEYSWADDEELDENYGEFVCSFDDFLDAVNDFENGDIKSLSKITGINGVDHDDINKMVGNENCAVWFEEIDNDTI